MYASSNRVGLANSTAQTKSISPSRVEFRDKSVVNYGVKSNVMLNPATRNFNAENVAGRFTTLFVGNEIKTIYDLNFAQSCDLPESNFSYGSSYDIANIENILHYEFRENRNVEQAYFTPQIYQSYESTKPQLFRNSSSTVQDPYRRGTSHVNPLLMAVIFIH